MKWDYDALSSTIYSADSSASHNSIIDWNFTEALYIYFHGGKTERHEAQLILEINCDSPLRKKKMWREILEKNLFFIERYIRLVEREVWKYREIPTSTYTKEGIFMHISQYILLGSKNGPPIYCYN